jgi:Nucleotidyltransferase substrate binding protein like
MSSATRRCAAISGRARPRSPEEFERLPFADLIRAGNAQGLLRAEWPAWRRFREMRVRTSHVYDAVAALAVVAAIPEFLGEAEHLCRELLRRRQ